MRRERKDSVRRGAKIDELMRALDDLRSAWTRLATHSGLEPLADSVEPAVDAVEGRLQELGVDVGGEGADQTFERLESVDAPAGEEVSP